MHSSQARAHTFLILPAAMRIVDGMGSITCVRGRSDHGTQLSCKKDELIQPHMTSIQLFVEDARCAEAWLKVLLADASQPRTVAVKHDGQLVLTAWSQGDHKYGKRETGIT